MKFHILTIFPDIFDPYLKESVIGKGISSKKLQVKTYDLRKFTKDKHNNVDDKPYGGGPGMVLQLEPIVLAMEKILKGKNKKDVLVLITEAAGKQFDNKKAKQLASKYKDIIILAGRYEGFDARTKSVIQKGFGVKVEEVSIGPYVLTGGELPALVMIDSISRQIGGVLGKQQSIEENRYGIGLPAYTRPEEFKFQGKTYKVPKVLLSGDHKKIDKWRRDKTSD